MRASTRNVLAAATVWVPFLANDAQSRRMPLFWCGAVAGFVSASWIFQSLVAIEPPADPARASALMGFAAIACTLYGLVPLLIAGRPLRSATVEAQG